MKDAKTAFDAAVVVAPHHRDIARLAIRSLIRHAGPRRIFVVADKPCRPRFAALFRTDIVFIDEDTLVPGLTYAAIEDYFRARGVPAHRAGWYFQQFLKMGMSTVADSARHCLLWDADTILLKPAKFFTTAGKVRLATETEYHEPYFRAYRKLLDEERSAPFSFIAQHQMIRKDLMRSLLERIGPGTPEAGQWVWRILDAVETEHLTGSGFSEYETYGNFIYAHHRDEAEYHRRPATRTAARLFGPRPTAFNLRRLARDYALATFETYHCANRPVFFIFRT